jgi:hypothetical protein
MAERVGFEPTCPLQGKTLSRRPRYDHFGTSPQSAIRNQQSPISNPQFNLQSPIANPQSFILPRPPALEKPLDQAAALGLQHAARDVNPVVQRGVLVRAHG